MTIAELQRAIGAKDDGVWGPASKAALLAWFRTAHAAPALPSELAGIAARLGCSLRQLAAVAAVESSGSGFDQAGRPKILFERHWFHRLTDGRWSPAFYSDPKAGGYDGNSWTKLVEACGHAPDAAFASCSWGKFQVMGGHWLALGYASPFAMAAMTITGEAAHYEMLARFVELNHLQDEMRAISTDPQTCRAFARAYNGAGYERFDYQLKLAREMR